MDSMTTNPPRCSVCWQKLSDLSGCTSRFDAGHPGNEDGEIYPRLVCPKCSEVPGSRGSLPAEKWRFVNESPSEMVNKLPARRKTSTTKKLVPSSRLIFSAKDAQDVLILIHVSSIPLSSYELSEKADLPFEKVEAIVLKLESSGLVSKDDSERVRWSAKKVTRDEEGD